MVLWALDTSFSRNDTQEGLWFETGQWQAGTRVVSTAYRGGGPQGPTASFLTRTGDQKKEFCLFSSPDVQPIPCSWDATPGPLGMGQESDTEEDDFGDPGDGPQPQAVLTYLASSEMSTCSDWSSQQIRMTEASGLSSGKNVRRTDRRVRWPTSGCCSSGASLQRKGVALANIKVDTAEARVSKFPLHLMLHPGLKTPSCFPVLGPRRKC